MKKIGTSMAAAMAVMRTKASTMFNGTQQPAIPVSGFRSKAKYRFRDSLRRISPTKLYASAKLRAYKSGNTPSPYGSGRGALGARERAVGKHWIKG